MRLALVVERPSSQANNPFHRLFSGALLSELMRSFPSIVPTLFARKTLFFLFSSTLRRIRDPVIYIIVGGISAFLYVLLNIVFVIEFSMRPGLAIVLTLVLLMPLNYLAQRSLAFHSSRPHRAAFPRYVAIQAIGNLVGIFGAELGSSLIAAFPWAAFIGIAAIIALVNYSLLRIWAFTHPGFQEVPNISSHRAVPSVRSEAE